MKNYSKRKNKKKGFLKDYLKNKLKNWKPAPGKSPLSNQKSQTDKQ
jgi:hypothetical protein